MVLLKPMLEGERSKSCTRCSAIGIVSPIRERSTFYPAGGGPGRYAAHCRKCSVRLSAEQRAARPEKSRAHLRARYARLSEEEREAKRAAQRERQRLLWVRDPEGQRERHARNQRAYAERLCADPERLARVRANRKIDAKLKAERRGVPLQIAEASETAQSRIRLPIGPFRAWVASLVAEQLREHGPAVPKVKGSPPRERTATLLGVTPRRLWDWLEDPDRTDIDSQSADRACQRDGRTMLSELYPGMRI